MPNQVETARLLFEQRARTEADANRALGDAQARTASASGQRLPTRDLVAAEIDTSKNYILQSIWQLVTDYNRTRAHPTTWGDAERYRQAQRLDSIYAHATMYCMDRWADPTASKRPRRWAALKVLLDRVCSEMSMLGLRAITGPTDFTAVSSGSQSYWLERLDPNNRPGWVLSEAYQRWLALKPTEFGQQRPGNKPMPKSFTEWLNDQTVLTDPHRDSHVEGYTQGAPLWQYMVHFNAAKVLCNQGDAPFTTDGKSTHFSGQGWAIWVCSGRVPGPNGAFMNALFSESHQIAKFHHSSFLGGAPVTAAGEWVVDRGVVKIITGKSGHYRPQHEDIGRFLNIFPQIPGNAIVRPDFTDFSPSVPGSTVKYYRVSDFRSNGLNAKVLRRAELTRLIPTFAGPKFAGTIADAPA